MDTINRLAFIVKPKKPFWDWANTTDPAHPVRPDDMASSGTVYLIPENDTDEQADKYFRAQFGAVFEEELQSMWTNDDDWPQNRTFKMFQEWFDFQRIDMVWDLVNRPIVKGY